MRTVATEQRAASKWLAMRGAEPAFQRWLADAYPAQWAAATGATPSEAAASVVRVLCRVKSRAEIDSEERANKAFHNLIRKPFAAYLKANP